MNGSKLSTVLVPVSAFVLVLGLAPAPAAAGLPVITGSLAPAPAGSGFIGAADHQSGADSAASAERTAGTVADAPAVPAAAGGDSPFAALVTAIQVGLAAAGAPQPAALPATGTEFREAGAEPQPGAPAGGPGAVGPSGAIAPGVADQVREALAETGEAAVIVRLREQPDLVALRQQASRAAATALTAAVPGVLGDRGDPALLRQAQRAARGEVVVDGLRAVARQSQPPVRALLDRHADAGRVDDVREFWVFNGLAATVDETALAELAAHPDVASVTLDETITLEEPVPAEVGEPLLPVWSLDRLNAPDAWGEYGVRGAGVVVGVMDSGVDGDHPALADAWRGRHGDPAASWFAATGENYPEPGDGNGHGTHVTGSIVGAPPGEVTGVAPDAEWIAAKIFTDSGFTSTSVIHAGFEWMLAPGGDPAAAPDVVNNSWGSDLSTNTEYWEPVAAWRAAGIVPIFSNGNTGPLAGSVGSPASFPHAIGVGATHDDDRIAGFSSRGPAVWDGVAQLKPDVSAPGHAILSTWPRQLDPDGYHTISGTSMAAPHVTGAVALVLSAAPQLSVDQVQAALTASSRVAPHMGSVPNNQYGAGIVDAYAAVTWAAHSGTVTGTVTGPAGEPVAATLTAAGASTETDQAGGYALRLPAGEHTLTVTGYGYADATESVTITVGGQHRLDLSLPAVAEHALTGTVAGPDGPVPGARVRLLDAPVPELLTGDDGGFTLRAAAGDYQLRVVPPGHEPATIDVSLAEARELTIPVRPLTGPVAPGWAQYQNHPARAGRSGDSLAATSLQPAWTARGDQIAFSSPVIAGGRVFIGSETGLLSVFDATDGGSLWSFQASPGLRGAPAVAGGRVFTGGGVDGGIHALDAATGGSLWTLETPGLRTINTAPAVVGDTVYAATGFTPELPDRVFAIDAATGEVRWSAEAGRSVFGLAVGDGVVVVGSSDDQQLVALDAGTGQRLWTLPRHDSFIAAPSVVDGTVYATTSGEPMYNTAVGLTVRAGSLIAVDLATGEQRWEVDTHWDGQGSTPAVYGELVIAGSHSGGKVVAYHRDTGEAAWHYVIDGLVSASVAVSDDGYVVGGSQLDQRLWVLEATTGELVWEQSVNRTVTTSAAYADGMLVTADAGGTVHAFHPSGQINGTVTGPDGPLPATITVLETGEQVTADPDTGQFSVSGLVPGTYTLQVRHYGVSADTRTVEVAAGRAATVEVTLAAVGDGAVAGVVTDDAGAPLAGATVTVSPTPLPAATTGEDGEFRFDEVAEGRYTLTATAAGYATVEVELAVVAGETTVVDVDLQRFDIAVVSDYENQVTELLTDAGWKVDRVSFDEIVDSVGLYRAVVLSGMTGDQANADPQRFAEILAQADAAGTSLVFLGTGGPSYGAIRTLSQVTGDPAVEAGVLASRGVVWLEEVVAHPITASLPAGRVPLLESNSWHAWFDGYSGHTLATIGNDREGQLGAGIGYQRRGLSHNHILLAAAAPSPFADWQQPTRDLLLDAVAYAADAEYGAVTGQVTGPDGAPAAARIEVVGGLEHTTAGDDGDYHLILDPGEHTLRVRLLGAQTLDVPVTVVAGTSHELNITLPPAPLGTVAGTVTEAGGDRPVAGVSVSLTGSGLPAVSTDSTGRYVIEDVPGGEYELAFDADGYEPLRVDPVAVTKGELTTVDAALVRAPAVVVVGDRNSQLTDFLEANSIPAQEAGWEVIDDLDGVSVVVLQNPPALDAPEYLAALAAFDEAGVSVIFPADGWNTRTRGLDMLVEHTGDPSDYGRLGGFSGPEIFLHGLLDHPVFEGIQGDPVQLLNPSSEAAFFSDYSGVVLADVAEAGEEPAGIGVAYNPRTPDSVHLLLTGLAATLRNQPDVNWTTDGQQIFLNAVRWAAAPGMAGFAGTVTDPDGMPIPDATVEVMGTNWRAVTDADGGFEVAIPPGEYTLRYRAFGYVSQERTLAVGADAVIDASAQLAVGEVGAITGQVSSAELGTLAGTQVILRGTPYQAVTDDAGRFTFTRVEPGDYELELEVADHVRTLAPVSVAAGATTTADQSLRPSPLVGLIDDSTSSSTRDRGQEFLLDWGYRVEPIGWDSLDRIPELDLVMANRGQASSSSDPGAEGLHGFLEAVNRAGVPVLWMDQNGRGSIPFLHEYDGDPAVRDQGFGDGAVTATVVEDHPLVAGLPEQFDLMTPDSRYAFFDEFGGTTVARLATDDLGELGATIAYRGRTSTTVDVLLSTMSVSAWGGPGTRQSPAFRWTPAAERVLVNALAWALAADGIGADVRGTVRSDLGGTLPSQVEVVETGRTYQGREGDGTFLVPLPPGDWTLRMSGFGHEPTTVPVSVEAGQRLQPVITLTSHPTGQVTGQITGPDGAPVADADVSIVDAPLSTRTGPDGRYALPAVPDGDWNLLVRAEGFQNARRAVTVVPGQAAPVDLRLDASRPVALAGDFNGEVARLLSGEGYAVDAYRYDELDLIDPLGYDLAVLNGSALASEQPVAEQFTGFVDAAATAELPVVFTGMQTRGSIQHLNQHYGDPETIRASFELGGPIYYLVDEPHPIFDGVDISEPVEIMDPGDTTNQQYMFFGGYSGTTLADMLAPNRGEQGDAVAYRFVSPNSVHLLLANLMAHGTNFGSPETNWSDAATRIYLNAVDWAIHARQAELTGTVRSADGGDPVAGATVTVVEAGAATTTDVDGSYAIGLAGGSYTVEVSAHGFAPASAQVVVPESGTVTLDLDLVPLPRGEVGGLVSSAAGGPVPGANVTGEGPTGWSATTDADGRYAAAGLLPGEYQVTVSADGFLPATDTVTVTAGQIATLDLTMSPVDVGVLGDHDSRLTGFLRGAGVPATELDWSTSLDLTGFEVLVVNGGSPDAATFEAVLAGADESEVSLVFTGSWAVDRGGIRLLERYTDRVEVGAQGFGDGPVQLTGFDPAHPVFAGLPDDPATLIVEGGYYSVLDRYAGQPLADLLVPRDGDDPVTGLAAGWDWRTAGSVELLLSASAVTEAVGPGLGWTVEGGQLLIDAIDWARDQVLSPPAAPTLLIEAPLVLTSTVAVSGRAQWPAQQVTVLRDGEPVATAPVAGDGSWSARVPLALGENRLTAVATNLTGDSPASAPVAVARWQADWEVRGNGPVRPVTLSLDGPPPWRDPAQRAELVVRDADGAELTRVQLSWVRGFYLHVLRDLPAGAASLRAELLVDGELLVIDGPPLA